MKDIQGNQAGQSPLRIGKVPIGRPGSAKSRDEDYMPRYVHSYNNESNNDCGQAAIAAIVDYFGLNIGNLPKTEQDDNDGQMHWNNSQVMQAIKQDGYGPDIVAGLCGTSGGAIQSALQHYGLGKAWIAYCGADVHWEQQWQSLQDWVKLGWTAACILDGGKIPGFSGFLNISGHWPVVFRIDESGVHLANCGAAPIIMTQDAFLDAWNYLAFNPVAYGYNHCMVVPYR